MPRGGKRPGAGRKKGAATRKTRQVADKAAAEGITPLEVMLHAMRVHFEAKEIDAAAAIAKDCAPYVHPRLSAVTLKGDAEQPIRLVEQIEVVGADPDPAAPAAP